MLYEVITAFAADLDAVARGLELVLHLHRLDDDNPLTAPHCVPNPYHDPHDLPGHGCDHPLVLAPTRPRRIIV